MGLPISKRVASPPNVEDVPLHSQPELPVRILDHMLECFVNTCMETHDGPGVATNAQYQSTLHTTETSEMELNKLALETYRRETQSLVENMAVHSPRTRSRRTSRDFGLGTWHTKDGWCAYEWPKEYGPDVAGLERKGCRNVMSTRLPVCVPMTGLINYDERLFTTFAVVPLQRDAADSAEAVRHALITCIARMLHLDPQDTVSSACFVGYGTDERLYSLGNYSWVVMSPSLIEDKVEDVRPELLHLAPKAVRIRRLDPTKEKLVAYTIHKGCADIARSIVQKFHDDRDSVLDMMRQRGMPKRVAFLVLTHLLQPMVPVASAVAELQAEVIKQILVRTVHKQKDVMPSIRSIVEHSVGHSTYIVRTVIIPEAREHYFVDGDPLYLSSSIDVDDRLRKTVYERLQKAYNVEVSFNRLLPGFYTRSPADYCPSPYVNETLRNLMRQSSSDTNFHWQFVFLLGETSFVPSLLAAASESVPESLLVLYAVVISGVEMSDEIALSVCVALIRTHEEGVGDLGIVASSLFNRTCLVFARNNTADLYATERARLMMLISRTPETLFELGAVQLSDSDPDAATVTFREAVALLESQKGEGMAVVGSFHLRCAIAFEQHKQHSPALPFARAAVDVLQQWTDTHMSEYTIALNTLAVVLTQSKQNIDEAIGYLQECIKLRKESEAPAEDIADGLRNLGAAYFRQGRLTDALDEYMHAYDALRTLTDAGRSPPRALGDLQRQIRIVHHELNTRAAIRIQGVFRRKLREAAARLWRAKTRKLHEEQLRAQEEATEVAMASRRYPIWFQFMTVLMHCCDVEAAGYRSEIALALYDHLDLVERCEYWTIVLHDIDIRMLMIFEMEADIRLQLDTEATLDPVAVHSEILLGQEVVLRRGIEHDEDQSPLIRYLENVFEGERHFTAAHSLGSAEIQLEECGIAAGVLGVVLLANEDIAWNHLLDVELYERVDMLIREEEIVRCEHEFEVLHEATDFWDSVHNSEEDAARVDLSRLEADERHIVSLVVEEAAARQCLERAECVEHVLLQVEWEEEADRGHLTHVCTLELEEDVEAVRLDSEWLLGSTAVALEAVDGEEQCFRHVVEVEHMCEAEHTHRGAVVGLAASEWSEVAAEISEVFMRMFLTVGEEELNLALPHAVWERLATEHIFTAQHLHAVEVMWMCSNFLRGHAVQRLEETARTALVLRRDDGIQSLLDAARLKRWKPKRYRTREQYMREMGVAALVGHLVKDVMTTEPQRPLERMLEVARRAREARDRGCNAATPSGSGGLPPLR